MNLNKYIFRRKKNILVWARIGFGRVLANVLLDSDPGDVGYIAVFDPETKKFFMFNANRQISEIDRASVRRVWQGISFFVIGIGNTFGYARAKISEALISAERQPIDVISPASFISSTALLGSGCIVMPGVVVQHLTIVSDFVILNSGSTLEHEVSVGKGCHIMSNGVLNGRSRVDDFSCVGSNATVFPDVYVGSHSFVGAGAIVRKDVQPGSIVVGSDHRIIGENVARFDPDYIESFFQLVL